MIPITINFSSAIIDVKRQWEKKYLSAVRKKKIKKPCSVSRKKISFRNKGKVD